MTPEELARNLLEAGYKVIRTYRAVEGDLRAVLDLDGMEVRFTIKEPAKGEFVPFLMIPMP